MGLAQAVREAKRRPILGSAFDHAMAYCAQGWSLYPQRPGSKDPLFHMLPILEDVSGQKVWDLENRRWKRTIKPFWRHQPTPQQLEKWFQRPEPANIGITCGELSGICVLEFDDEDSIDAFGVIGGFPTVRTGLPKTPTVLSRRGIHVYFQMPSDPLTCLDTCDFGSVKMEVKGEGKTVTAPPSVHQTGHIYGWIAPFDLTPAPLPIWVMNAVYAHRVKESSRPAHQSITVTSGPYIQAAINGEVEKLLATPDGSRRSVLRGAAWKLAKKFVPGQVAKDTVIEALTAAAVHSGMSGGASELRSYITRSVNRAIGGD